MHMTERQRPPRRPLIPRWTVFSVVGVLIVIAAAVTWVLVAGIVARTEVPDVVGLSQGIATTRLAQIDLVSEVAEHRFDASPSGTVLEQDPAPGTVVSRGDSVRLVVSAGSEQFELPDVVGLSSRVAQAQLEQLGLVVRIDPMPSEAPTDTVIATNPSAGATVRTSDIVRLVVAAEADASSALLPYRMDGIVIVLDPSEVASASVDAPMEVARRLQSLLEASGVDVTVTRSAASTDTSPAGRVDQIGDLVPTVVVGLDAPRTGDGGFAVTSLAEALAPTTFQTSRALADEIARQLGTIGEVTRGTTTEDVVLQAVPSAGVRVQLGSYASPDDVSAFSDPARSDELARAIYRALGERFGSQ